jgi:hypothetical protein
MKASWFLVTVNFFCPCVSARALLKLRELGVFGIVVSGSDRVGAVGHDATVANAPLLDCFWMTIYWLFACLAESAVK